MYTGIYLRSLSCMCPHMDFEMRRRGKGPLVYFARIANRIKISAIYNQRLAAKVSLSGTLGCTRSLSCMFPHMDSEVRRPCKGPLAYFARITNRIKLAAFYNQRLNSTTPFLQQNHRSQVHWDILTVALLYESSYGL